MGINLVLHKIGASRFAADKLRGLAVFDCGCDFADSPVI
jgi:hypothetical protein